MADNVAITPGSGATIAADDVGSVLYQRVKLGLGADGAATDALGGAGAVAAGVQRVTLASDDPAVVALQDTTTSKPVSVHTPSDVISFTPTLDTAAYASGDVLFATAAIAGITRANDERAALQSLTVIDKSKNKPAFTLFFYQTNVTSAAANAANNLSDADAVSCLGFVDVASTDWKDLANNSFACIRNISLLLEAATGTTSVYVVGILNAGTPTFANGDLVLKLGVVQA
jgi:hypothetical protein